MSRDKPVRDFVQKIVPAVGSPMMLTGNTRFGLCSVPTRFLATRVLALETLQFPLRLAIELRRTHFRAVVQRQKVAQAQVNTAGLVTSRDRVRDFNTADEDDVPVAVRFLFDGRGLHVAFYLTMETGLHPADLGKDNTSVFDPGELWKTKSMGRTLAALESGEAFTLLKEGFKGFVEVAQCLLEQLRLALLEPG